MREIVSFPFTVAIVMAILASSTAFADSVMWTTELDGETKPSPQYFSYGNMYQIIVEDAVNIYTVDNNGTVYSLDKETGEIRWKTTPTNDAEKKVHYLVNAGACLVYYDGKMVNGLNFTDGTTIWTKNTTLFGEFSILPTEDNMFVMYGQQEFYALDATSGDVSWSVANRSVNVNQVDLTTGYVALNCEVFNDTGAFGEMRVYESHSGMLIYTFNGAQTCSNLNPTQARYLACTFWTKHGLPAIEVIDLKTQKTSMMASINTIQPITLHTEGDLLLVVVSGNQFSHVKGYISAFDLANNMNNNEGPAPLWNVSLGHTFDGFSKAGLRPLNGMMFGAVITNPNHGTNAGVHPTQFIALDRTTGKTVWVIDAPTNWRLDVFFSGADSFLIPNLLGWYRFTATAAPGQSMPSADAPPALDANFANLDELGGMTTILGDGDHHYFALVGTAVRRYEF